MFGGDRKVSGHIKYECNDYLFDVNSLPLGLLLHMHHKISFRH